MLDPFDSNFLLQVGEATAKKSAQIQQNLECRTIPIKKAVLEHFVHIISLDQ
jgi:hypothetical protein